jgi:hypothetical protein
MKGRYRRMGRRQTKTRGMASRRERLLRVRDTEEGKRRFSPE